MVWSIIINKCTINSTIQTKVQQHLSRLISIEFMHFSASVQQNTIYCLFSSSLFSCCRKLRSYTLCSFASFSDVSVSFSEACSTIHRKNIRSIEEHIFKRLIMNCTDIFFDGSKDFPIDPSKNP